MDNGFIYFLEMIIFINNNIIKIVMVVKMKTRYNWVVNCFSGDKNEK